MNKIIKEKLIVLINNDLNKENLAQVNLHYA